MKETQRDLEKKKETRKNKSERNFEKSREKLAALKFSRSRLRISANIFAGVVFNSNQIASIKKGSKDAELTKAHVCVCVCRLQSFLTLRIIIASIFF